jgi:hypothetical protein
MTPTITSYARIALLVAATVPACDWAPYGGEYCEGDWAAAPAEAGPPKTAAGVVAQVLAAQGVDILFVIDDSRSMLDEQEQLGIWSKEMFNVLSESGQLPDLHIAITSSSVAISGMPGCERGGSLNVGSTTLANDERFIRDVAGPDGRVRNYTGTLTETFAKMARVGASGCGFEQPFKAAQLALSGYQPGSKTFLRDAALLLVVFVTDEDDCSALDSSLYADPQGDACTPLGTLTSYRCFEHGVRCHDGKGSRAFGERANCRPDEDSAYLASVERFAGYLKGLKQNPAQVIVAGIYGKPNGITAIPDEKVTTYSTPRLANVCGTGGLEGAGATPAVRMNALMAEFGGRASHSSICESELSWAMRDVGLVTRAAATRSHCLRGALVDVDNTPGIQPRCRVYAATDARAGSRTESPIEAQGEPWIEARVEVPACGDAGGSRCFTIEVDPTCGDTETQLAFHVDDEATSETLTVACDVDTTAPDHGPANGDLRAYE